MSRACVYCPMCCFGTFYQVGLSTAPGKAWATLRNCHVVLESTEALVAATGRT